VRLIAPTSRSRRTVWPAKHTHADVTAARDRQQASLPALRPERLVFLDETGITTDPLRRHARSSDRVLVGDRAHLRRWHSSTLLAGVRLAGITAPCVIDGPILHDVFLAHVTQVLASTLRRGDAVVLNNLETHQGEDIPAAVQAVGSTLHCLPPYSLDLNPIELCFAKLKAVLLAARPRTLDVVCDALAASLGRLLPAECARSFQHCRYPAALRS
jgi:transposase